VRQAIAADLFELAESSIQKTSALIGREVKLGNEQWSVLAVVNSAWDESKRWITVTRFFITEGLGKLNDLITYQQTNNLKFDPFDKKQPNEPNKYNTSKTKETDILSLIFDNSSSVVNDLVASPLIFSSRLTNKNQKIPIKAIHQLAQEKAKISSSSKLVTWAYDVEGLKKPHYFLVIYSASPQADQYLYQSFQVKQQRLELREGEHQILTIIKKWINEFISKNDIIEGTFDLNYLDINFLIKKRMQLQTTYTKIGYVLMNLQPVINTIELNQQIEIPEIVYYASFIKYEKKIPIMSNMIYAYTKEWLALGSILITDPILHKVNQDNNYQINNESNLEKGINNNGQFIRMNKEQAKKIQKGGYIYEIINTENFMPYPSKRNIYKYFTVKPIKINRVLYIDNVFDQLKNLKINVIVN
jgi:hypothetical protein